MSGQRKAPRPVGRGYMPKGGASAAAAANERWRESVARRAAESAQPHTVPVESASGVPLLDSVAQVGVQTDGRGSGRESVRRSRRLDLRTLPWFTWVCLAVCLAFALLFVSAVAASAAHSPDCVAVPEDPECAAPSPTPTPTPEPSPTPTPEPSPASAPGVDTGVYLDPASGSLRVDENTGVALGVACWLAAVTAGLGTAWMVLP